MNYSKVTLKNKVLKIFYFLNALSFVYWACGLDAIISWQPYAIMIVNALFLGLGAYINGWVMDTEPYYERMEKEND